MADRTCYVGDTYPPVYLQVSDETGVLNLTTGVTSIAVKFIGATHTFGTAGTTTAVNIVDPDHIHTWNVQYTFAAADTASADVYQIFVVVTYTGGIETYATTDTLTVKALPA